MLNIDGTEQNIFIMFSIHIFNNLNNTELECFKNNNLIVNLFVLNAALLFSRLAVGAGAALKFLIRSCIKMMGLNNTEYTGNEVNC
jgi:hypothetical protein